MNVRRLNCSDSGFLSAAQEFKVVGGCKVKDTTTADYHEIKIVLDDYEDKVFEIRRNKGGGKLCLKRRDLKFTFENIRTMT